MTTVIEIPDGPTERPIPGEETGAPETTVEDVIETALDIVEVIQEAVEDADDNGKIEVLARLSALEVGIAQILTAVGALAELVTPPEVEEILEALDELPDEPDAPAVVVEAETVEEIEAPVIQEEVPVAETPQIRQKKSTRWV